MGSLLDGKRLTMNGELLFNPQPVDHANSFRTCTLHGRLLHLKQDSTHLHYRVTFPAPKPLTPAPNDTEALLRHYFNLDTSLEPLYRQWSDADANFKKRAPQFKGVRILSQDAWETLICFICSSNNNITRISQMVSVYRLRRM